MFVNLKRTGHVAGASFRVFLAILRRQWVQRGCLCFLHFFQVASKGAGSVYRSPSHVLVGNCPLCQGALDTAPEGILPGM